MNQHAIALLRKDLETAREKTKRLDAELHTHRETEHRLVEALRALGEEVESPEDTGPIPLALVERLATEALADGPLSMKDLERNIRRALRDAGAPSLMGFRRVFSNLLQTSKALEHDPKTDDVSLPQHSNEAEK